MTDSFPLVASVTGSEYVENAASPTGAFMTTQQIAAYTRNSYSGAPLAVSQGGTGDTILGAHSVMIGQGTSAVGTVSSSASGLPLVGQGALSDPVFTVLGLAGGGLGISAGTSGAIPFFDTSGSVASSAALTNHGVVLGGGAGGAPTATAAATNGQQLFGTTGASPFWGQPALSLATPATTSVTPGTSAAQMLGLAGALTPLTTGRVEVDIIGAAQISSVTNGVTFQMRYGTGTAPTNGAPTSGTSVGAALSLLMGSTTEKMAFSTVGFVSGAATGTALWFDLSAINTTGSQAVNVAGITIAAKEV